MLKKYQNALMVAVDGLLEHEQLSGQELLQILADNKATAERDEQLYAPYKAEAECEVDLPKNMPMGAIEGIGEMTDGFDMRELVQPTIHELEQVKRARIAGTPDAGSSLVPDVTRRWLHIPSS